MNRKPYELFQRVDSVADSVRCCGGVVSEAIRQSCRRMIQRYLVTIFCFAAISLLYLLSVANAEETRVVVAYSSINPNSSHLEIARAQGFYRKYGLDPEIILVRSSATATAGLAAGNIQFGFIGGSALLNAAAEGLPSTLPTAAISAPPGHPVRSIENLSHLRSDLKFIAQRARMSIVRENSRKESRGLAATWKIRTLPNSSLKSSYLERD